MVPEVLYLLAPLVQPLVGGPADRPGEPGAPLGIDAPDAAFDPFPSVAWTPSVDAAVRFFQHPDRRVDNGRGNALQSIGELAAFYQPGANGVEAVGGKAVLH